MYIIVLTLIISSGCQPIKNLSPQEVLKNSIEQPSNIQYYAESTTEIRIGDSFETPMKMKEWRNNEVQRLQIDDGESVSTSITNGEQTITYAEGETVAYQYSDEGFTYGLAQPKDEMDTLLSELYKSHEIKLIGDETIAKRKTFHLLATPLNESGDASTYDIWIDKQYWIILKMDMVSDEVELFMEYDTIEFSPKFPEDIFLLEAPEGYVVESINATENEVVISLDEARDILDHAFLYFDSNVDFSLHEITYQTLDGMMAEEDVSISDISFHYIKNDVPFMELTVIPVLEEVDELPFKDKEMITIRGKDVFYVEDAAFLSWREDGFLYMIDFYDPNITVEQIKKWTDEMDYSH